MLDLIAGASRQVSAGGSFLSSWLLFDLRRDAYCPRLLQMQCFIMNFSEQYDKYYIAMIGVVNA